MPAGSGQIVTEPKRMKTLAATFCWIALAFLLAAATTHSAPQEDACVACHSFLGGDLAKPVDDWKNSVHRQNDITCDLCHGGKADVDLGDLNTLSSTAFDEKQNSAMSKDAGFVARPSGRAMFDMCGQCHDDSVSRYAASIMGRAYLDGRGGPSCVTCHNAHDNVMPAVPKVCESCHSDTAGYERIDPMRVTEATIGELSRIRVELAAKKTGGMRPLLPQFPEELDTYQIGLLAFGAVLVVFLFGCLIYVILEKRR